MIDIEIGIMRPEVTLRMPARQDSLPLVRQALRSLGETVDADLEALEDAELAVTEACANAVEHAYGDQGGDVAVTLVPEDSLLRAGVADHGVGISQETRGGANGRGFGLSLIESIATHVEFESGEGTDVRMALPLGHSDRVVADGLAAGIEPAEQMLRRLVAVVAAQRDMSTERMLEGLLLAELVARSALRYLVGDHVQVHIEGVGGGFELRVGPLKAGGAGAVVADSEVPVVGSVVEKLADEFRTDYRDGVEHLALRVDPRG